MRVPAFCLCPAGHRLMGPQGTPGSSSSHGDTALGSVPAFQGELLDQPPQTHGAGARVGRGLASQSPAGSGEADQPRGPNGRTGFPLSNTWDFLAAPAPLPSLPYLPAEEGSETAWTMSVDSASKMLVRNSFFLAPGQPTEKVQTYFFPHVSQNTE